MYIVSASLIKASRALSSTLVKKAGGSSAIANSLEWDRQYMHIYLKKGYIPLQRVFEISALLKVSPWALSYFKLVEVLGPAESPSFHEVLKKSPLLPEEKEKIAAVLK